MTAHDQETSLPAASSSSGPQLTEEEASRYDRQMRLWGLEAQQRMRNATILVVQLKGTATEAIKNMVLAGIGKLIMVDGENVTEEDLGTGFLFRDEDVGKNIRMNEVCRRIGKPFYAGGTYGLLGYIFCDLLNHDYIAPDRSAPKEGLKNVKKTAVYSPLNTALRHRWNNLTKRQTKEVNPAIVFSILAIWEYQSLHGGSLPDDLSAAKDLSSIADLLITEANVNKQVLTQTPEALINAISTTAAHEFSPVCAIVGGMLGQDILKALAAREPPIANFFVFDGNSGAGTVTRMAMP
ncbi:hypothetical protein H0H92_009630 [Tricholoma furcatifolium]|nr:hypothetical protein H0H92_009630 [Tricholoma furcatifolium]